MKDPILRSAIILFGYLATAATAAAGELAPFTSDGCSAFPEGTSEHQNLWLGCCRQHDFAYWQGGTAEQRAQADEALQQCVAAVGEPEIAALMLAGVRVGGSPYWPTSFRWGYGWPYFKGYGELTKDELEQVEEMTRTIDPDVLSE